jgi:hypothetical protein
MLMNVLKDLHIPIRNGKVKRGYGYMCLSGKSMSLFVCMRVYLLLGSMSCIFFKRTELTCVGTYAHTKIHYYETFYAILKRVIASTGVDEEEDEDEREENAQRYDQKYPLSRPAPRNLPAHAYTHKNTNLRAHVGMQACALDPILTHTYPYIYTWVSLVSRDALEAYAVEQKKNLGLNWVKTGDVKPAKGHELKYPALAEALTRQTKFSQPEWEGFGIHGLHVDHFIQSGDSYFQPASGEALEKGVPNIYEDHGTLLEDE